MSRCKSCDARVRWVITKTGANMPIDIVPVADGNISVELVGGRLMAEVHKSTPQTPLFTDDRPRYKSHFATCPDADTHRKGK